MVDFALRQFNELYKEKVKACYNLIITNIKTLTAKRNTITEGKNKGMYVCTYWINKREMFCH